jgi:phosphoribosylglycinamide formyltransferase-1
MEVSCRGLSSVGFSLVETLPKRPRMVQSSSYVKQTMLTRRLIYDPKKSGKGMSIVCFVSGSGTNYREIVARDRSHNYIVFTNRPGCAGAAIAKENKHPTIELSHTPFLEGARKEFGSAHIPRNHPARIDFEKKACRLIEIKAGREPDLICLAGYDQWLTDWMVNKYYPRILNVHPGDTTKCYDGLHWIPSAKAIIAGDEFIRSTLFLVDKGEDTGPVLVQSRALYISDVLRQSEPELAEGLNRITTFAKTHRIKTYEDFKVRADAKLFRIMENICKVLQDKLKVAGDWEIYPFAVHDLIAQGRVEVDGRKIYLDGNKLARHGYIMS